MRARVEYRLPLDLLLDDVATFASSSAGVSLTLPRARWEDMGRPGFIDVTPEVSS